MSINKILVAPARSGSTWVCQLLNEIEGVVAADEPFSRERVAGLDVPAFLDVIEGSFHDQRRTVAESGTIVSTRLAGQRRLGNHYRPRDDSTGLRTRCVEFGTVDIEKPTADFTLVIKHTIPFAGVIDQLVARYPTFVLIRNPLALLASWDSIEAGYRNGRVQDYAVALTGDLAARLQSRNRISRQVALLEWHFERFLHADQRNVIRYEDVVATGIPALAGIAGPKSLRQRTTSVPTLKGRAPATDPGAHFNELMRLPDDSAIYRFYDRASVEFTYAELRRNKGRSA